MLDIEAAKTEISQKLEILNHRLTFFESENCRLHEDINKEKSKNAVLKKAYTSEGCDLDVPS